MTENDVYTADRESLDVTRRELGKGVTAAAVGTAAVAMTAGSAQAQSTQISGTVTDSDGTVGGATVVAVPHDNSLDPLATTTASDGTYQFAQSDLHNGTNLYHVIARDGTQSSPRRGQQNYPFIAAMGETAIPDSVVTHASYDASELSLADSDPVSSWPDESGNGHELVQTSGSNQPTFTTSGVNDNVSVEFGPSSSTYMDADSWSMLSQPYAFFAAVRADEFPPGEIHRLYDHDGSGDRSAVYIGGAGPSWRSFAGSGLDSGSGSDVYVVAVIFDGSDSEIRLGGSSVATGDAGTNGLDTPIIGSQDGTQRFWDGPIAEMIFASDWESGDISAVEDYLAGKWGGTGNESSDSTQLLSDGGWDGDTNPQMVYVSGDDATYFGATGASGEVRIGAYDHTDGSVTTNVLKTYGSRDDHQYPAIDIRDDGHIQTYYTNHGNGTIYSRVSTNPSDISSFDSEFGVASNSGSTDYPNVGRFGSDVWVLWRGSSGNIQYATSSDGGDTWSSEGTLVSESGWTLYVRSFAQNGLFHFAGERWETGTNWTFEDGFYAHIDNSTGELIAANGTVIGDISTDAPLSPQDLDIAYDSSVEGSDVRVYSVVADANDNPQLGIQERDKGSGSGGLASTVRWTGSGWQLAEVVDTGAAIRDNEFIGCEVDPTDIDTVYSGVGAGSSSFKIAEYTTDDGGQTWSENQVITDNSEKSIRPIASENHDGTLPLMWMRGRYDALDDFDTEAMGWTP